MDSSSSELALQQQLQRFTTELLDRITQAADSLERSVCASVSDEALRKHLLYVSSALEIATGPVARVNLLDMLVFVRLSRAVLERHWVPDVYGDDGRDLLEVFVTSESALERIAERELGRAERADLTTLVDTWLAENPAQLRVEGIRLADFAEHGGGDATAPAGRARGLLTSMKSASRAANDAVLLSERGLFLVHRLPSVWRIQARLGAREMLADATAQLLDAPESPLRRLAAFSRTVGIGAAAIVLLLVIVIVALVRC